MHHMTVTFDNEFFCGAHCANLGNPPNIIASKIVVPAQRWTQKFILPPIALYRSLRRTNPSPFMFYFNFGGFQVIGASPEILVRVFGDEITIRPIAGTRPRGETHEQDLAHEKD
ncbi:MAG: hypothetical protein EB086_03290, partial [Rhodobacteraceae bacterium]|nr:hypothetical protein [Paracoccaceae bacterium]